MAAASGIQSRAAGTERNGDTMTDLGQRVAELAPWHYRIDLGGVTTETRDPAAMARHEARAAYLLPPLLAVCGGTLAGRRVLDLGCNAGWWSLQAAQAGAAEVVGVDGRPEHVEQAGLVFDRLAPPGARWHFEVGDVTGGGLAGLGRFDVVLCLGLLYHVSRPVELMEAIAGTDADIVLIDTTVVERDHQAFHTGREPLDQRRNAVDRPLILTPTRRAVVELCAEFGYRAVPLAVRMPAGAGVDDFLRGRRLGFLAVRGEAAGRLAAVEAEGPVPLARLERLLVAAVIGARRRVLRHRHTTKRELAHDPAGPAATL